MLNSWCYEFPLNFSKVTLMLLTFEFFAAAVFLQFFLFDLSRKSIPSNENLLLAFRWFIGCGNTLGMCVIELNWIYPTVWYQGFGVSRQWNPKIDTIDFHISGGWSNDDNRAYAMKNESQNVIGINWFYCGNVGGAGE